MTTISSCTNSTQKINMRIHSSQSLSQQVLRSPRSSTIPSVGWSWRASWATLNCSTASSSKVRANGTTKSIWLRKMRVSQHSRSSVRPLTRLWAGCTPLKLRCSGRRHLELLKGSGRIKSSLRRWQQSQAVVPLWMTLRSLNRKTPWSKEPSPQNWTQRKARTAKRRNLNIKWRLTVLTTPVSWTWSHSAEFKARSAS